MDLARSFAAFSRISPESDGNCAVTDRAYRRRHMFGIRPMEILFLAAIVLLIGLVWIFVRMVRDDHRH